jgi:hypothetical protein
VVPSLKRDSYRVVPLSTVRKILTGLVGTAAVLVSQAAVAQPAMARISGIVVDERDRPLAGVRVALPCPPAPVREVISDEAGRFLLDNLLPGNCRLMATKDGYITATHPGDPGVFVPAGYSLILRQGESRDGERLQLTLGGRVAGRITTPPAEGPLALTLHLLRREVVNGTARLTGLPTARVAGDGSFLSPGIGAGDYVVAVSERPDNGSTFAPNQFAVTYFPGVLDPDAASLVAVQPGKTTPDINFSLVRVDTRTVQGIALNAAGQPMSSGTATIFFTSIPGFIRGSVPIRSDGRFIIRGLQPGRYRLSVSKTDASRRATESGAVDVEIGLHDIADLLVKAKSLR